MSIKETSMVGAVAGHNGQQQLNLPPTIRRRIKKYNPKKKRMNKNKKVNERANMLIRDTIFKIILEQNGNEGDKIKYILGLYDGIAKKLGLSFNYAKNFMTDAIKVEDVNGALKFNLRRAKAELRHVQSQIDDMTKLVDMMYQHAKERNIEARNNEIRKKKFEMAKNQRQQETEYDRNY